MSSPSVMNGSMSGGRSRAGVNAVPAPAYGDNGTNIFGVNSPIKSMAGDNKAKQQSLMDYYNGVAAQNVGVDGRRGLNLPSQQAAALVSPQEADQEDILEQLKTKLKTNADFAKQIGVKL